MNRTHTMAGTMRHVFGHAAVTLLAVGISLSLPRFANYVLFTWWPKVANDSHLLVLNEISLGAFLVLFFNLFLLAREGRLSHRMRHLISLAHVRQEGSWLSRRLDRTLLKRISGTRDISVMSITGHDIFVDEKRNLQKVIDDSYELRVLLMNPYGSAAKHQAQSAPDPDALLNRYRSECKSTIDRLAKLASSGKKITLKFYDDPPFWNLILTGEYVWVQYCYGDTEQKNRSEYVFELNRNAPDAGLFSAFYVHFLNHWTERRHPDYDFATGDLIYRNRKGNGVNRVSLVKQYPPSEQRDFRTPERSLALCAVA